MHAVNLVMVCLVMQSRSLGGGGGGGGGGVGRSKGSIEPPVDSPEIPHLFGSDC